MKSSGKYPSEEYATSYKQKIEVARDQLAGKEMEIGRYYLTKKDYTGAIQSLQSGRHQIPNHAAR